MTRRRAAGLVLVFLAASTGTAAAQGNNKGNNQGNEQRIGPGGGWQPGLVEVAISSCAGGAMIGVLVAYGGGAVAPLPTAALFCGLSVSATVAANAAGQAWRGVSNWMAR